MAAELRTGFIISAKNQASKPLRKVEKDVGRLKKKLGAGGLGGSLTRLQGKFGGIDSTVRKFRASIFAITMAVAGLTMAFKKMYEWTDRAAKFEDMEARFKEALVMRGVKDIKIFMGELHHATKGMISDFDLIRNANFALYADLPVHLLPKYLAVARATAKTLGRDLTATSQQILRGLVTGYSITMKRALLITKDKRQVLKKYGEENHLAKGAVNELTEAEKTAIYAQYVFNGAYKTFGHIFEDFGFSDLMSQMASTSQNVKDKMGDLTKYILGPYLKAWWSNLTMMDEALKKYKKLDDTTKSAIGMLGAFSLAVPIAGLAVLTLAYLVGSLLNPAMLILGATLAAGIGLFYAWTRASLVSEGRAHSFKSVMTSIGYFLLGFYEMVGSKISKDLSGTFEVGTELWLGKLTSKQRKGIMSLATAFDYLRAAMGGFGSGMLAGLREALINAGLEEFGEDFWKYSEKTEDKWRKIGVEIGKVAGSLANILGTVGKIVTLGDKMIKGLQWAGAAARMQLESTTLADPLNPTKEEKRRLGSMQLEVDKLLAIAKGEKLSVSSPTPRMPSTLANHLANPGAGYSEAKAGFQESIGQLNAIGESAGATFAKEIRNNPLKLNVVLKIPGMKDLSFNSDVAPNGVDGQVIFVEGE